MSGLTVHTGDTLTTAARWLSWDASERRRRAIEACRDRDHATLWELTKIHLTLHGKAGARVSPRTLEAYEGGVKVLLAGWQGVSLIHATKDDAAMLVRQFEEAGLSTSTIQVRLAGIRALYRALRWAGATDGDPFRDVRPARDPTPAHEKRFPYSEDSVSSLLSVATGEDLLLLLLGGHAGLRVSECMAVQWTDLDFAARRLVVRSGKGGKMRTVIMSVTLTQALRAISKDHGYVISGYRTTHQARNRIKALCEKAGTHYLGIHSLRHYCGTRMYRQTGRLEDAQHHLGHEQIGTTQIYARYADTAIENSVGGW